MAWLMRRRDRGSGWYVCFHTAGGREVRRAAGKSRRSAERIKAKIETQLRESRFFNRDQTSTWTLEQLSVLYLERLARLRPRSARWRREMYRQVLLPESRAGLECEPDHRFALAFVQTTVRRAS